MTKDFPSPEFPSLEGEETVVGVHVSGITLEEGLNTSLSRNYCSNCRRKIHCYVKVDRKTKEAVVHNTCKNKECECKCKTHYACKQCGYLHPYGKKCNRIEKKVTKDPKVEANLQKIIAKWRKQSDKTKLKIVEEKPQ